MEEPVSACDRCQELERKIDRLESAVDDILSLLRQDSDKDAEAQAIQDRLNRRWY
jgi:methylphosphotriester-DNA--protein-cysteine methyltransferase